MRITTKNLRTVSDSVATCSLLLTLAVLIGIGVLSYGATQRFLDNDQKVAHTEQVLESLSAVLSDLKDAETGQRGYLLTGDPAYLPPYRTGSAAVQRDLHTLRSLTRDNAAQQRRLDALQSLSAAKLAELGQTISLRRTAGAGPAMRVVQTGHGRDLMTQTRELIRQMQSSEQVLLAARTAATERAGAAARLWSVLGTLLAVLLILTAISFINNYLRQRERVEGENLRLAETARDAAVQQRTFLKDVLASVTEGRLALCDTEDELPAPLFGTGTRIPVTRKEGLRALRQAATQAARGCGFPEERVQDLATSVSEAGMNAATHGGGGQGVVYTDGADCVQVWITDGGAGISLNALPQSTLERGYSSAGSLGHGFWLMLKLCDRVFLLTGPQGTTVVLQQAKAALEQSWMSQDVGQTSLTFKTAAPGSGGSASDVKNLSFRTHSA